MREVRRLSPCGANSIVGIHGTVLAVIFDLDGVVQDVIKGTNIVTNDGDLYYAQMAVGDTPTDDFTAGGIRLGSDNTAPTKADTDVTTFIASTGKADVAGYPKVSDADGNNSGSGADIVTWAFTYTAGDFTAGAILEGAIVDNITTPTAALSHFLFAASFAITATDALTVFVNHEFLGA